MGRLLDLFRGQASFVRVIQATRQAGPGHKSTQGRQRRILVVEDDEVIVELLSNIFARIDPGIEIDGTPSGEVAEALLRNEMIYDLVILDVNLHDRRTGIHVWLSCHAELPSLPFVFMSAMCEREFRKRLGADARQPLFVPKPCSVTQLTHVLAEALDHAKAG